MGFDFPHSQKILLKATSTLLTRRGMADTDALLKVCGQPHYQETERQPLRAQFGDRFALWTTALAFVVMHLPTWISSHATASTYAAEVPEKLLFGLVAGWSVLRLDSLAFALGMHVGGNFTGVLLDSLSREETLTGWSRFTTPSVIAMLAETLVTAAAVWYLGRPSRKSTPHR